MEQLYLVGVSIMVLVVFISVLIQHQPNSNSEEVGSH